MKLEKNLEQKIAFKIQTNIRKIVGEYKSIFHYSERLIAVITRK